jgi:hypothetical protein
MSKNDTRIKEMMATVAARREALGSRPKVSWQTNGMFKSISINFNINTVVDRDKLVEGLAIILATKAATAEAAKLLEVPEPKFEYYGYPLQDWITDFKTRISVITWDEQKVKLQEMENKLACLVSEEAKTEMALDDIAKSLG